MSKDLLDELWFFRSGAVKKADPRARMRCGFALVEDYAKQEDYRFTSGSRGLSAVCEVASAVLLNARSLDRLMTSRQWSEGLGTRKRNQIEALQSLLMRDATQADLFEAMELANNVFRKMLHEFSRAERGGEITDSSVVRLQLDHDRYRCAVILPQLVALMKKSWVPLCERIRSRRRRPY